MPFGPATFDRLLIWPMAIALVLSLVGAPLFSAPQTTRQNELPAHRWTEGHRREAAPKESKKPGKKRKDSEKFARRVESILAAEDASKADWGILVAERETGEVIYEADAEKYFLPASNMKLFTTALAMTKLGPEYRFTTTVFSAGAITGEGRLAGDLILLGTGDPNLSNRKFPYAKEVERDGPPEKLLAELANAVVARGIKQIEGNVIADDSYFAAERYPNGWEIDDMVWSYGAAVSAIAVNDNTVTAEIRPGEKEGDETTLTLEPWTEDFAPKNQVLTSLPGTKSDLTVTREPGSKTVGLSGTLPAGSAPRRLVLAIEEPAEHAARLLKRMLEARGITITGEALARHYSPPSTRSWPQSSPQPPGQVTMTAAPQQAIGSHTSVMLADAVRVVNKISQNLHAEMLLRTAARQAANAMTLDDALKFAREFYESIGIAKSDLVIHDGSGLSRRDLVTPSAVVKLLRYADTQPWAAAYEASLPISGEDGTLADRMKQTSAAGRIRAKTGSVEHVSALSGFAETVKGQRLVFSIIGNNFAGNNHDEAQVIDAICAAMVEEIGPNKKTQSKSKPRSH